MLLDILHGYDSVEGRTAMMKLENVIEIGLHL